jgi:hypothetical protein
LTAIALQNYWVFFAEHHDITSNNDNESELLKLNFTDDNNTQNHVCEQWDVNFIKTYLIGVNVIVALNLPLLFVLIRTSARGTICDLEARKGIVPLLYLK